MTSTGLTPVAVGSQLWVFSMLLWTLGYVSVNFIYNEAKVTTTHDIQPVRLGIYWAVGSGIKKYFIG